MLPIPALSDLLPQMRQKFKTYLQGSDAWVPINNIGPSAKVIAAGLAGLYGKLDFVMRQAFVSTAETGWLDLHGAKVGLTRRAATAAAGNAVFTAATALTVNAGTVLVRSDGAQFVVNTGGSTSITGTLTLPVQAVTAGSAGICQPLTPLTIQTTATVTGTATVTVDGSGLSGALDNEGDDAFRARILFRMRFPYAGGAAADYVTWAGEVTGVTRVYVERAWAGPGTVRVFPMTDGLTVNGIPNAAVIAAVAQNIALYAPAATAVTVQAPVAQPIAIGIQGLAPATQTVENAILAALTAAFIQSGNVAGNDTLVSGLSFLAVPYSFSASWIWQAIANAAGTQRFALVAPTADTPIATASVPVIGPITYS